MPMNSYSVPLRQVVEEFNLTVSYAATNYDKVQLMVEEVMRPGLQLTGFFNHFEPLRLQVIGNAESTYLRTLSHERLEMIFDELFSHKNPALIYARNIEPLPECMEMAKKYDITILRCLESTSYVVSSLITYLMSGLVVFSVGIPCAVSGIVGNLLGSHFALKSGAKFIRPMMLVVLVLLLAKILSDAVL